MFFVFSSLPAPVWAAAAIMLKRIPRFTPPEVIVGLLAPFVRLSTSSVSIIKKRASQRSDNYGFVELDSHAVSGPDPSPGSVQRKSKRHT